MDKAKSKFIGILIILIIVMGGVLWLLNSQKEVIEIASLIYETNTTLSGDQVIPAGETYALKNNATLTIEGNYTIDGNLECQNGPLMVVVTGDLRVNGQLKCERNEQIPEGDIGNGISLVVKGNLEFSSESIVVTNGHVQLVDEIEKLAKTQEEIDKIFDETGDDSGEGPRIGPFIPIDLAPDQQAYVAPSLNQEVKNKIETNGLIKKLSKLFVAEVLAAEAATDIEGNVVPRTVKIGGKWIIGQPNLLPPFDINVPTPPKGIKKIIIAYDFGPGANVNIADLNLAGPDGRPGTNDEGASCNAKGGQGENACRLNVKAANITINNFTLRMGNGGDGGSAVSQINCDPGIAVGGEGGEPGNIKMQSSGSFKVLGQFKVIPGLGGFGGEAIAAGKTGKDGCPGENGGEAKATGGKGGDNKKGLKTVNVEGLSNITIETIQAGKGGDAYAHGGDGGNGTGPGCAGGTGGKATATGGQGGTATSRTVASTGGDGGNAEAYPGDGGDGGKGTVKDPGGNGGAGGPATAQGGKAGTGRTGNGADGQALEETGGNGGNGGDGCPEGKGGAGGLGKPQGQDGEDGKNICPPPAEKKTDIKVGEDVNTNTNTNTNGGATANDGSDITLPPLEPLIITPNTIRKKHIIGESSCPDPLGMVNISGPTGRIRLTIPAGWITPPALPANDMLIETEIVSLDLQFNCNITNFSTHPEQTRIKVEVTDEYSRTVDSFFDVFMDIELPE